LKIRNLKHVRQWIISFSGINNIVDEFMAITTFALYTKCTAEACATIDKKYIILKSSYFQD